MADSAGPAGQDGSKAPTIEQVAILAGVSTATVSRVVSGRSGVRDVTRARVERAIAATGWTADPSARQLAGGPGDEVVLAVAVADRHEFASDPYYARVLAGAGEEAARQGLSLCVHVAALGELPGLMPFRGRRRHVGAVIVNASAAEAVFLADLARPVVSMGALDPAVPSVDPENSTGASRAAGHLLAQGRQRIATIAGPAWNPCARERLAGYRSCIRAAGLPEVEFSAGFSRASAAAATRRLLETSPELDAIFVASDLMATAVLQVLMASGRRVPDDVAVVGFDDSPPALMTTPALSTVRQPVEALAALAVRTLTGPPSARPPDQRMATHLIVRASSDPPSPPGAVSLGGRSCLPAWRSD
jgi:DNA-binding LacI/PurR family transcriptional regulator